MFWKIFYSVIILASLMLTISGLASPLNQLRYYEIIDYVPQSRSKRDVLGIKTIRIKTTKREYTLHMKQVDGILTNDFHLSVVDSKGNTQKYYNVREPQPYEGIVAGEPNSFVTAYLDESDSLTAIIDTKNDTIMIEKLSRYNEEEPISSNKMIVYKQSDFKAQSFKNQSICGNKEKFKTNHSSEQKDFTKSTSVRIKRGIPHLQNTCELLLVADYRFHNKYGRGNRLLTSNYLIELISRINRIYRQTNFRTQEGATLSNFGFSIKHILIHGEPSTTDRFKYNQKRTGIAVWDKDELLKEFSRENYEDYCLTHLFTYQQFSGDILGYAHIGSPLFENPGGICSQGEKLNDGIYYFNTAFTTFQDGEGNSVLTLMAHLSVAHELGHNWGAFHDPDNDECSPGSQGSGKYIMYSLKVTGYEPNNIVFSNCSKRSIGAVLNSRAFRCFTEVSKSEKFCGNQRIDAGEECDVGSKGDECCTSACTLRANATCSKQNSLCCTSKCQLARRNTVCAFNDEENPCEGAARCTGDLSSCPPREKYDRVNCAEHGTCLNRLCVSFCEYHGMRSCICDNLKESCLICCQRTNDSICTTTEQLGRNRLRLNNGRPCAIGVCKEGECKKRVQKLSQRLWLIIKPINSNSFVDFLRDNLVGTVIVLSLLFWIPACYAINWSENRLKGIYMEGKTTYQVNIIKSLNSEDQQLNTKPNESIELLHITNNDHLSLDNHSIQKNKLHFYDSSS